MVESGLKIGRIVRQAAIKATIQDIQGGSGSPNSGKPSRIMTNISGPLKPSSYAILCSRVGTENEVHSIGRVILQLVSKANERCEYHSVAPGHNTDNCWTLKGAIEKLIDHGVVVVTDDQSTPNVTINPLPAQNNLLGMICDDQEYELLGKMGKMFRKIEEEDMSLKSSEPVASLSVERVNLDTKVLCVLGFLKGIESRAGKEIVEEVDEAGGLTRSRRCYSLEELGTRKMAQNIQVPLKKAVTQEEAEEFLKKIKVPDYSVVEQLKKTPAQISLLSLLVHCEERRRVLNKILNEAHVSKETTVNQLEKMAKRIFESNTITFIDDELPTEGARHNRALLLTVKCEGYYVKRVMIDGGSGVEICPLSTLQSLKINPDRIRPSNVFVQAYDGSRQDTIGEIKLNMTIGPVEFMIVFQVMDMDTSYNFLLGSPWIIMARVVTSTIYQVGKFEYVHQEIIVHWEEGDPIIQPCLFSSSSIVATTILKYGYQPGKGLGLCLQGIVDPITLLGNQGTSGLRYNQTKRNGDKAKNYKRIDWVLPQPIPHISHSFINPQVAKGTSHADVQLVGLGVELNNWEAAPFPIRKESW
ncbi:hypothetical protein KY290_036349 [Solanum tuberosum]|uniref:G-patch domain-containing protein n=1 Tax=Solanum tuberosum TaxID=4113 RepID=A0ABQ7TU78_SOLTU|nr:hypothetical protein KY290_036349 [Solanum tuberosum]